MIEDETLQRSSLMADQQDRPDEKPDVPPPAPPPAPPPPAPESASPPPAAQAPPPAAPPPPPAQKKAPVKKAAKKTPRQGRQEGSACQEGCREEGPARGAAEDHAEAGRYQRRSQHSGCSQGDCGESEGDRCRCGQSHGRLWHGAAGGARTVTSSARCCDRGGRARHPVGDRGASTRRRLINHLTLTRRQGR